MNFSMIARRRLRALGLLLDVLDAELAARGAELANAVGLRGVRMPVMSGMSPMIVMSGMSVVMVMSVVIVMSGMSVVTVMSVMSVMNVMKMTSVMSE